MSKQNNTLVFSATLLVLGAAFTRLFPHAPNFTALGAMAIFGGSVIKNKRIALVLPLVALLLSDVCLQLFTSTKGFYGITQFFVYVGFIIITGMATLIKRQSVANIAFAAVWSAAIFFVLSNLGVWLSSETYPKTLTGLGACYAAAIPFYKNDLFGNFILNSVMSNAFYSLILFGAYTLIEKKASISRAVA